MNARQPASDNDFVGAFARVAGMLPGRRLPWLRRRREEAIARFAASGFPTQRDEDWKYTSVAAIAQNRFNVLPAPCPTYLAAQVAAHALPGTHLLVFVNGQLEPELCRPGRLPHGVVLRSLGYSLETNPAGLEEALAKADASSPFSDLNLAFMADGAYIRLPPGAKVKIPIQLLFIAGEGTPAIQPHNLLHAGAGASATVVEHHISAIDSPHFTNSVTDIVLDEGASVEHIKLQHENRLAFHVAMLNVDQGPDSRFNSASFSFGAHLARIGINVSLHGEGARCGLDGLYVVDSRQHVDHHTRIDHHRPRCTSREMYKGIVGGIARAVFNGRVIVHPGADGSDAEQTNHNLLLSENAEIDTKPQLEIWADDVKCSHGATVGQLDEDEIFYLRSRGIAEAAARSILTRAFAREMIDRVSLLPVQERLDTLLSAKLPQHERRPP